MNDNKVQISNKERKKYNKLCLQLLIIIRRTPECLFESNKIFKKKRCKTNNWRVIIHNNYQIQRNRRFLH